MFRFSLLVEFKAKIIRISAETTEFTIKIRSKLAVCSTGVKEDRLNEGKLSS